MGHVPQPIWFGRFGKQFDAGPGGHTWSVGSVDPHGKHTGVDFWPIGAHGKQAGAVCWAIGPHGTQTGASGCAAGCAIGPQGIAITWPVTVPEPPPGPGKW